MKKIILASTSPRRKQLMMHLGLPFKVVASNYHEIHHKHLAPAALVKFLAAGKAAAVAKKYPQAIVIGADTIVMFGGRVFGKPKNHTEAYRILRSFSGRVNYVYTAVAVMNLSTRQKFVRVVKSKIYFRKLNHRGIKNYLATGEPLGRAGAYAVQDRGAGLIKKIVGDYSAVVGLPLGVLQPMLKKFGIKI